MNCFSAVRAVTHGSHSYTWNADNRPATVDGVGLTFDALGRMVEQNKSGAYSQIVWAPTGGKLALMSGQTLSKAFVGLPGGGQAVYNSSGLLYYGHADHLGNIRLGSTSSRAVYFDLAYAPFGEIYTATGTPDTGFTGMRSDTSGGLYDFPAREYSYTGRWSSPDPAGLAAVDPTNPQSWNRYAYVKNSPLNRIDPSGMKDCPDVIACGGDLDLGEDVCCVSDGALNQVLDQLGPGLIDGGIALGTNPGTATLGPNPSAFPDPGIDPSTGWGPDSAGGGRAPVMNPQPRNCTFWGAISSGFSVTTKKGFAFELGLIGFDASLNTDSETQQKKIEASFSFLRGKLSAERSINPGNLNPDTVDPNTQFNFSAGPFKKNLVTGDVEYDPSANAFKFGGALFFGKDISFNPDKVEERIAVCKGE